MAKTRPLCIRKVVHPVLHDKNLLTFPDSERITLAGRHAKVRRDGYRSKALGGLDRERQDFIKRPPAVLHRPDSLSVIRERGEYLLSLPPTIGYLTGKNSTQGGDR